MESQLHSGPAMLKSVQAVAARSLDSVRSVLTGYVYIIYHGQQKDGKKAFKIGKSSIITARILHFLECQLCNVDCFEIIHVWKLDNYGDLETELHRRFKDARILNKTKKTEWFWLSDNELHACIAEVSQRTGVQTVNHDDLSVKVDKKFLERHAHNQFIINYDNKSKSSKNPRFDERFDNIRRLQNEKPDATLQDIIDAGLMHLQKKTSVEKTPYGWGDLGYDVKSTSIIIKE